MKGVVSWIRNNILARSYSWKWSLNIYLGFQQHWFALKFINFSNIAQCAWALKCSPLEAHQKQGLAEQCLF